MSTSFYELICIGLILFAAWSGFVWAGASAFHLRAHVPQDWSPYWTGALCASLAPAMIATLWLSFSDRSALSEGGAIATNAQPLSLSLLNAPQPILQASPLPWIAALLSIAFGAYTIAKVFKAARQLTAVRRIVRQAEPIPATVAASLATDDETHGRVRFLASDALTTAFAVGGTHPAVIIPRLLLETLTADQLRLIVAHELAHIRRRDPEGQQFLFILEALFWFNPFIRLISNRLQLAAELACDAEAVGHESVQTRLLYARTYLDILKLNSGMGTGHETAGPALQRLPAAYIPHHLRSEKMRLTSILNGQPSNRKTKKLAIALGALAVTVTIGAGALQAEALKRAARDGFLPSPVAANARLTSNYGERTHPVKKTPAFHHGIDLAAPLGTPLHAPTSGTVLAAKNKGAYGNIVKIDHGDGLVILYAQLDSFSVRAGQSVNAGDEFAKIGMSGKAATGPHLHLETFVNGTRVDPETIIDVSMFHKKGG